MKLWLRIDVDSPRDPRIGKVARQVGLPPRYAFGMVVATWCAMGEHAPDGNLAEVDDALIEEWAGWMPTSRKDAGRFAKALREAFCDDSGVDPEFAEQQGALVRRMEKDRNRKRSGDSPESPGKGGGDSGEIPRIKRGKSNGITERNGTEEKKLLGEDRFEEFWAVYPRRSGTNPKHGAETQWRRRLRDGATADEIIAGAQRYRELMETTGKIGTEYVMQAVRFLGKDKHFEDDHAPPPAESNGDHRAHRATGEGRALSASERMAW